MKKIILTLCALSIAVLSFGQKASDLNIDKSKVQFNIGVGLSYDHNLEIPAYVGVDYWVTPDITAGLEADLRLGFFYIGLGGLINGNYHFAKYLDLSDKFDFYGGLSMGPYIYPGGGDVFDFDAHLQVGGRYKINDKMWVQGELVGGIFSGARIGITFRR